MGSGATKAIRKRAVPRKEMKGERFEGQPKLLHKDWEARSYNQTRVYVVRGGIRNRVFRKDNFQGH